MKRIFSGLVILGCLLVVILWTSCSFFEKPDAPSGLTAVYKEADEDQADDYVELKWDDITGVSQYEVYRGNNEDPKTFTEIADPDEAWYDDFEFDYYNRFYAIKAENNAGTSDFSEVVEANIPSHDSKEPNNDLASATTLNLVINNPNDMRLSIMPAGDIDCLKFYADTNHGYNISINANQCSVNNIQMTLFDENGNVVETGVAGSGVVAEIFEWTPSQNGDYILKIQSSDINATGYYIIYLIPWT